MSGARLAYLELPLANTDESARFFGQAFGRTLERFGPADAATHD